jgi:hypothetical protein
MRHSLSDANSTLAAACSGPDSRRRAIFRVCCRAARSADRTGRQLGLPHIPKLADAGRCPTPHDLPLESVRSLSTVRRAAQGQRISVALGSSPECRPDG